MELVDQMPPVHVAIFVTGFTCWLVLQELLVDSWLETQMLLKTMDVFCLPEKITLLMPNKNDDKLTTVTVSMFTVGSTYRGIMYDIPGFDVASSFEQLTMSAGVSNVESFDTPSDFIADTGDVETVVQQCQGIADVSAQKAAWLLWKHQGDIVDAIMEATI
jgi:NACalpha-BTF3-like transcription factor